MVEFDHFLNYSSNELLTHINYTVMKKIIEILTDEKKSFEFPLWVPAVLLPIGLVVLMCIAGWLDGRV